MPVETIRGVNIVYTVVGDHGPWLALTTGGRRGHGEFLPLARKIAARGVRVLLHDRRNTGASDIKIDGEEAEEEIWADDLHELLSRRGALPAFVGGSSSGARMSILFALRHPQAVRGLLLMRITGGAFAATRLPETYYAQFIRAAQTGGMAAVCDTEQYRERIAANPANRDRLMAMQPQRYISVMSHWHRLFLAGADWAVMGVTDDQLRSIKPPTIVIPGNDKTHNSNSGRIAQSLLGNSRLHQLPIQDQDVPLIPFEEWAPYEAEIASVFVDFMHDVTKGQAPTAVDRHEPLAQ
ncbi:MAG TPA: alpha/beta hydrolase [Xanthobacteraceae bacterium]|jgi:pimeloyl-ACP methyl ester carboxylesterase